jgi:hypothetical protein
MKQDLSENGDILNALREATKSLGIDLEKVFLELGLPKTLIRSPEQLVSSHIFNIVLETIARDYHCKDFALHLAKALYAPRLGFPAQIMAYSATIRSGLEAAEQYRIFYQDTHHWQHSISEGQVTIFKPSNDFVKHFQQRNLFGTAQIFMHLSRLSNNIWQPNKISFSFADPLGLFTDKFETFFECELAFDRPFDGVHFKEDYLDFNIVTTDLPMLRSAKQQIGALQQALFNGKEFIDRARLLLNQRLRFSYCTEADLASDMEIPLNE